MKTYKISEIFYSIQGEGFHVGEPTVFVRFHGCNMECPFCDTNQVNGNVQFLTAPAIVKKVKALWKNKGVAICTKICFTGGEPLLQLDEELVNAFLDFGMYDMSVETNGTLDFPANVNIGMFYVTVSPKIKDFNLEIADGLKFIYPGTLLVEDILKFSHCDADLYIQPLMDKNYDENLKKCIEFVMTHPQFCLSIQTHKIIGMK